MTGHNDNALIPEDWKKVARKDWNRLQRNLEDGDAEAAGFFLQQSLEKYLKAYLLQHGWKLRKVHVLHELLNETMPYQIPLETFRDLCERVSGYYLADRYPPLVPSELTCEEVEQDMKQAKELIQSIFPDEKLNL